MASYGRRVSNSDVVQSLYGRTSVGSGIVTDINHQVEQVTDRVAITNFRNGHESRS